MNNTTCANCNKTTDCSLVAHDTVFGEKLSYFCDDCWVIVYGEGEYGEKPH